ncbi:Retrovirus-related Pol polyprotein from transposon TNT 1-94 [Apostasia shenzhenica]|uniref:Retrovirus-related Pol polyprotein from transposon TNT 1-94 n=1 Tax=Apostasia shenzhenica TaxID=1088818 RepID=A0A2I0B828_9ASPA|nr:Retrovirus-related Pol polyprotein from transposon TNT 1-94 [Apostasia shenzhenica]
MALVAHYDFKFHQIDVKIAFLNGDIEKTIYMLQLEGFKSKGLEQLVYKLKNSIYSLMQASRNGMRNLIK